MILGSFINNIDLALHEPHELLVWLELFYHPVFLVIRVDIDGDGLKGGDHPLLGLWLEVEADLSDGVNIKVDNR